MERDQYLMTWLAIGLLLNVVGWISGKYILMTLGTVLIFVKAMSWYWDRNADIS
jgi:hypothetical protein